MLKFTIEKKLDGTLARAGEIETRNGVIKTPAFVTVGTKATVKSLTAEQIRSLDAQVVLANTYHLYLQPGADIVEKAGGFGKFMDWHGPTMTDSGGFQAFSLGAAFGSAVSKVATGEAPLNQGSLVPQSLQSGVALAKVTDEGVMFKSHLDGSKHLFTPESSMEAQWKIGADMIFAFDECTSPTAPYDYQKKSLDRTFEWAKRSLARHDELDTEKQQSLFAVIQGGRHQDLREEAARSLGSIEGFDGFGIGGSFTKEDIGTAVGWVNAILPEDKPRHLLGIGEPLDLFNAVEAGCDLFDCIAPTRMARHGTLHTKEGRMNIKNAKFVDQFIPIEDDCTCYICQHHTRAYLAHLFRGDEMTGATLASIHNLHFILRLVENIRESILNDTFHQYKKDFLERYYKK